MIKKKRVWIIGIIVICGLVAFIIYLNNVKEYQRSIDNIQITDIDISKIDDGTYTGEYNVNFISAKVAVTIKEGVITRIDLLKHKNEKGAPAERITEDIINEQKVDVNTITGATNSSKVIKKAVENALR